MMTNTLTFTETDLRMSLILDGIRELSRGRDEEALEAFGRALAGTEEAPAAALCSARLLILRRRYDEATELLGELAEGRPDLAEAQMLLGRAHRARGRIFEAMRAFRAVLALEPWNASAEEALREILEVQEP
jgi:Flp pilus assembly protein TadD